jgi:hypothetical protein
MTFPIASPDAGMDKVQSQDNTTYTASIATGAAMTQDEVIALFRLQAENMQPGEQAPMLNTVILELAQLLADSRGKLSKENFDTLVRIGGALYREGKSQFDARADVATIMNRSTEQ